MNKDYYPELVEFVKARGGRYQCPECGGVLRAHIDFVVVEEYPALAVSMACHDAEACGYETFDIIRGEAREFSPSEVTV